MNDPGDPELASAIQESIDLEEEASLRRAMEESRVTAQRSIAPPKNGESSGSQVAATPHQSQQPLIVSEESDDEDLYASPTRLETALSIAGAGPHRPPVSKSGGPTSFPSSTFGVPSLLLPQHPQPTSGKEPVPIPSDSEDDMEEVTFVSASSPPAELVRAPSQTEVPAPVVPMVPPIVGGTPIHAEASTPHIPTTVDSDSDDDMEQVQVSVPPPVRPSPPRLSTDTSLADHAAQISLVSHEGVYRAASPTPPSMNRSIANDVVPESPTVTPAFGFPSPVLLREAAPILPPARPGAEFSSASSDSEAEPNPARWSRSPSPSADPSAPKDTHEEGWDAAQEMDPHAEEDEYTRFLSQMKGKDIDTVRREIDDEISELNKQKKSVMRDSEDITQQMISQIIVRPPSHSYD